jgi:hypothetical protein
VSKAILEFTLPEEALEYVQASHGAKLSAVVVEWGNELRNRCKYGDGDQVSWEEVRTMWWDLIKEFGLPEEVIQ